MSDFCYVKFDETKYWNKDFVSKYGITKIIGVYVFDSSERTYCCEMTPSYFLEFCGNEYETSKELTQEEFEEIEVQMMEAESNNSDSDHYRHCDTFESKKVTGDYETIQDVIENYHCNPGNFN